MGTLTRASGRHLPVVGPVPQEPQSVDQLPHHFFVGVLAEQTQGEHVVDDDPSRQQPRPLLHLARFPQHIVNEITMENSRQDTDVDPIGKPALRLAALGCHARTLTSVTD